MADVGFKQAMQLKWVALEKRPEPFIVRKVESIEDRVQSLLQAVGRGEEVDKAEAEGLAKKRKLLAPESWKTYK